MAKVFRYGRDQMTQHEAQADGASVKTGMLLERTQGGFAPHSTAGSSGGPALVAKDHREIGMELGDTYPQDEGQTDVVALQCSGGSLHVLLASGETVSRSTYLTSDGAGAFRTLNTGQSGNETVANAVAQVVEDAETITVGNATYAPVTLF